MIIQKFESYSEDEGILQDIFSGLEDNLDDISIEVQKTFLSDYPGERLRWNIQNWNDFNVPPGDEIASFYDIFSNPHPIFHNNISRLLPDSEIINIKRRWSIGHAYRDIPFYIVRLKFKRSSFLSACPHSYSEMASKFGFMEIYDSRSNFTYDDYITRFLVFYHENCIGH